MFAISFEKPRKHPRPSHLIFQCFRCFRRARGLRRSVARLLLFSRDEDHGYRTRSHCDRLSTKPGRLCWERDRRFNHVVGSFIRISRNPIGSAGSRRGAQLDAPTSSSDSNLNRAPGRSDLTTNSLMKRLNRQLRPVWRGQDLDPDHGTFVHSWFDAGRYAMVSFFSTTPGCLTSCGA